MATLAQIGNAVARPCGFARPAAVAAVVCLILGSQTAHSEGPARIASPLAAGPLVAGDWQGRVDRQYMLSARVRPLLFWIRRENVGWAQITWRTGKDSQAMEMVIGSDPERVPMRINRWGYIGEFSTPDAIDILGLMTQSDEQTIDEAKRKVENGGRMNPYRVLRTRIRNGESETTVVNLSLPATITYRSLDQVREHMLLAEGRTRLAPMPVSADYGFLASVSHLVRHHVREHRAGRALAHGPKRRYLYASVPYDITVQSTRVHPAFLVGGQPHVTLESEFLVVNSSNGRSTKFRIVYGVEQPIEETPVRVTFRPNWWFEAELNLADTRKP